MARRARGLAGEQRGIGGAGGGATAAGGAAIARDAGIGSGGEGRGRGLSGRRIGRGPLARNELSRSRQRRRLRQWSSSGRAEEPPAGRTVSAGRAGEGTGRAAVASVSRGFMGVGGVEGPSGIEPRMVPPSGSAGTAGMRSLGGSGVDQVRGGEVGACSTLGEGTGGGGTGTAGGGGEATGGGGTGAAGGGVAIAGLGGSGVGVGAGGSGDAVGAGGSGDTVGDRGAGAGSGAAGRVHPRGRDSPRLRHGRGRCWPGRSRLAQQARRPLRGKDLQSAHPRRDAHEPDNEAQHDHVERASEPDMQMPRVTAGEPRPVSMGKGSGCPWEAGPGSVMSPLLPRVPAFAYGLLRVPESPPARPRVSPRSGEPARAGLETGTSRSATEAGDATGSVPMAAGGVARSTPASLGEFAVGGRLGKAASSRGERQDASRHVALSRLTLSKPRAGAATDRERAGEKRPEEASGHRTSLSLVATAERGTGSRVATVPSVSQTEVAEHRAEAGVRTWRNRPPPADPCSAR